MVDEEQHILRYWEKEFPHLKPRKNRGGNRIYSEKDIELIRLIKNLLRVEKLSLKGAKEAILKLLADESGNTLFPDLDNISLSNKTEKFDEALIDLKSKKKAPFSFNDQEAIELLNLLKKIALAFGREN